MAPDATIYPSWLRGENGRYGPTLVRKSYGRIWVRSEADVDRVLEIARRVNPDEVDSYMPADFIAVWPGPESAKLAYGYKFELRTDLLEYECFVAGIQILIVTGEREG
jgi:hypothetical protein